MKKEALNDEVFDKTYEQYAPLIYRTAYQYLLNHDAAQDMVQDVFVSLFCSKKVFRDKEHEKAWLIRVTVNKCKNYLKSKRNQALSLHEEHIADTDTFENNSNNRQVIQAALRSLNAEQRLCILLYYYEGYKVQEIAALLHLKPNTVKSHLSRARKTMKAYLEKE